MRTPRVLDGIDPSWCIVCEGAKCSACAEPRATAEFSSELLFGVGITTGRRSAGWSTNLGWDVSSEGADSDARALAWTLLRVAQLDDLTATARATGGAGSHGTAEALAARSNALHAEMIARWPPYASPRMKAMLAARRAREESGAVASRRFVAPLRSIRFDLLGAVVRTTTNTRGRDPLVRERSYPDEGAARRAFDDACALRASVGLIALDGHVEVYPDVLACWDGLHVGLCGIGVLGSELVETET